jgi:hypothetical protein
VAVRVAVEKVVFVEVGVTVADGVARVWVYVGGSEVWVGNGVCVADLAVFVAVGEEARATITEVGVRVEPGRAYAGVGVGKKTPETTGSIPSTCPSSRRIISNTAGFRGATSSKGHCS